MTQTDIVSLGWRQTKHSLASVISFSVYHLGAQCAYLLEDLAFLHGKALINGYLSIANTKISGIRRAPPNV